MTIEPQKEGESLEDRMDIEEAKIEEEEDVEMGTDSSELVSEPTSSEMDSEDVSDGVVEMIADVDEGESLGEPPEPETAPVGPADYESQTHVAPQILEEAHKFLNQFGIDTEGLSPKEVMAKIKRIKAAKAEAAQVFSRGRVMDGIDRILSFVPKGFIGEFKRENDIDVSRAKALGFVVFESEEANLASSTGTSDNFVRFGDQILMVIPEEQYVAHRLVKADRLAERRKAHSFKSGAIDQSGAAELFPLIEL